MSKDTVMSEAVVFSHTRRGRIHTGAFNHKLSFRGKTITYTTLMMGGVVEISFRVIVVEDFLVPFRTCSVNSYSLDMLTKRPVEMLMGPLVYMRPPENGPNSKVFDTLDTLEDLRHLLGYALGLHGA